MKLSILVPVYNAEEYVLNALKSIPVRSDIEVIVIDDGSTDNSYQICKEFLENSKLNYTLLKNDENMMMCNALNRAIEFTSGEYVTQLDSDDEYFPDIEEVIDMADSDLVWFNMVVNDGRILSPNTDKAVIDHACLFSREIIGDSRWAIQPMGSGVHLMQEVLKKPHTERYTNKLAYKYNYPRVGSVVYNALRGQNEV